MKKLVFVFVVFAAGFSSCHKEETFLPYDAQLKIDVATIDKYLDGIGINYVKDTTGLRYVVNKLGTGKKVWSGYAAIKATTTTLSGSAVNVDTLGYAYPLTQLFKGLAIGIPHMPKGSTFTFYLPSGLAYGNNDVGFGSNVNLIVKLTLLDDDIQLAKDVALIDAHLDSTNYTVVKDTSGLRLVILAPGGASHPTLNSTITFDYTASYLGIKKGAQFSNGSSVSLVLNQAIRGFQIGIPYIGGTGHVVLYIPSTLAYGFAGVRDQNDGVTIIVQPNANVVYDVTLRFTN